MPSPDIPEALAHDAASGVKSTTVDGVTTTLQDASERIAVDRYQKAVAAQQRNHRGLSFTKLRPPGAV